METQRLHRGRLIDHLQLVVHDLNASRDFYTAVLAVLDIPIVDTSEDYFWADELVVSSTDSPAALGIPTGRHQPILLPFHTNGKSEGIWLNEHYWG